MDREIIVIGGGAAGMLAAIFASREGARVRILERNEKLGKKVYITGKGRCNLTNACEPDEFMEHILRSRRFSYAALSAFDNRDMMELIEKAGVPLKVERGERVFPESDKSSDITSALRREIDRGGVTVELGVRVKRLLIEDGVCRGVLAESGREYPASRVIVATGGISYPATGSTGDGYDMAGSAGLRLTSRYPALTPVEVREDWPRSLTGLSLKNVALSAIRTGDKKPFFSEQGEMMFTHFGITGPLVLKLSSLIPEKCLYMVDGRAKIRDAEIFIDLKPALTDAELDQRLLRDLGSQSRLGPVMDGLEPHSLAQEILRQAEMSPARVNSTLTREERLRLGKLIKALPLTPVSLRGFDEAIITRGGVDTRDVNPSTMESKRVSGLYFAGEVLDIDATTGGFNLQIAFSTGALAGTSAAKIDVPDVAF